MPIVDLDADVTDLPPDDDPFLQVPVDGRFEGHPYVRRLRREIVRMRQVIDQFAQVQREMVSAGLIGSTLEPLNPARPGVYDPVPGFPTIVHVDFFRLQANRINRTNHPTIRFLLGGPTGAPRHCHWLRLDVSELRENPVPLPGRSSAYVVVHTHRPVTVLR